MWLIAHKDAPAPPRTLALPCGAAPLVRPPPRLWAAGPALAGGRHRGDGALAPRPGLRRPVPSTAAPAHPGFHGNRPGWPTGDEPHGGESVPGVPSASGGRGCSHRCHSDTWSACGHLLTCEPLVWVTDGTAKASGPALCRVGHHGRSWPRPGLADQPGRAAGSPRAKCDQWCWGPGGAAVALGLQGWKGMRSGSGRVCGEGKENRAGGGRRGNPASATHRPCDLGSPDLSPALLI